MNKKIYCTSMQRKDYDKQILLAFKICEDLLSFTGIEYAPFYLRTTAL